jgi:hypothetical protein
MIAPPCLANARQFGFCFVYCRWGRKLEADDEAHHLGGGIERENGAMGAGGIPFVVSEQMAESVYGRRN